MKQYKLAVLENCPVTYRIGIYEKLHQRKDVKVEVLFGSDFALKGYSFNGRGKKVSAIKKLNFPYRILHNNYPVKNKPIPKGLLSFEILSYFRKERPDAVIVYGYQSLTHRLALVACKILGIPVIFRDEIDFVDESSKLSKFIKKIIHPIIFKFPSAFLYSYTRSKEFYLAKGVKKEKLFSHPCAVENDFFKKQYKTNLKNKNKFKKEFGLNPQSKVMLYVGRIEARKRVMDIVKAYERIKDKENIHLFFVGNGSEEKNIKAFAKEKKLKNVTVFPSMNREELYKFYISSDLFVIPSSYDPSPKSLNEAMNFSLPVITSSNVGTAKDLVFNDKNGYVIDVGNIKELQKRMEKIIFNPKLAKKMGQEGEKIVSKWNYDEDVKGVMKALKFLSKK